MRNLSLKTRIYIQVLSICVVLASIAGYIIYQNSQNSKMFMSITQNNMPKIERSGAVLAMFRDIRIRVRSIGLAGNTAEDFIRYEKETIHSITVFLEEYKKLESMDMNETEKAHFLELNKAWADFYLFGQGLLDLLKKGDPESMAKLNELVRNVCKVKADPFVKALKDFIEYQVTLSNNLVDEAISNEASTKNFAMGALILGVLFSMIFGGIFAHRISNDLDQNIKILADGSNEMDTFSQKISEISSSLSDGSLQQASSLQQTVASINQISAMIEKNADNAGSSAVNSEHSITAVHKGKEKVQNMVSSINAISSSNEEIVSQMKQTTNEISEIVNVIKDIATKTQVINDIVFQTKLLSFNASVEAARAGENGKGFAVVAEEVGNLASMSGAAASEISTLLKTSTDQVSEVVSKTQGLMDRVIRESKSKVDTGIMTAHECSDALDEILENVITVNNMVKEISSASNEQSIGVREVNNTMIAFDKVTNENSQSAQETAKTAEVLKLQSLKLNHLVGSLTEIIEGKNAIKLKKSA